MKQNKRTYKKSIKEIGGMLCGNFMEAYCNIEGVDRKKINDAIGIVLGAITRACDNSNTFFGKGVQEFEDRYQYAKAKNAFFKELFAKINDEFTGSVNEALKLFNEAVPEDVKKANKAAQA